MHSSSAVCPRQHHTCAFTATEVCIEFAHLSCCANYAECLATKTACQIALLLIILSCYCPALCHSMAESSHQHVTNQSLCQVLYTLTERHLVICRGETAGLRHMLCSKRSCREPERALKASSSTPLLRLRTACPSSLCLTVKAPGLASQTLLPVWRLISHCHPLAAETATPLWLTVYHTGLCSH